MMCGKWLYFILLFFSLVPLSAQELYGSDTPLPQEQDTSALPQNSSELDSILDELETIFLESDDASRKVSLLVSELQSRLEESRAQGSAAATSLENSANSLASSVKDMTLLYRNQRLELWIWRGVAALSVIGLIIAF